MEYTGPKTADKVIVIMGSGADTCKETINYLNKAKNITVVLLL